MWGYLPTKIFFLLGFSSEKLTKNSDVPIIRIDGRFQKKKKVYVIQCRENDLIILYNNVFVGKVATLQQCCTFAPYQKIE